MPTLLSLFDESGNVSLPYARAGWDVIQIDLAYGDDILDFTAENIFDDILADYGTVDHVIAQPPCTDFTASGARWWNDKDRDGRTEASRELVHQTLRIIDLVKPDVWWLENPVGRLEKLCPEIGDRRALVHPWHFAGYLTPYLKAPLDSRRRLEQLRDLDAAGRWEEFSDSDVELTRITNAYTKATCLWGNFRLPDRKPVEPVNVSRFGSWLLKYGGKSARTKRARSETPLGFAFAMFEANKDVALDWQAIEEGRQDYPMPASTRFDSPDLPAPVSIPPQPQQLALAIA
jgi:hypothetical protein